MNFFFRKNKNIKICEKQKFKNNVNVIICFTICSKIELIMYLDKVLYIINNTYKYRTVNSIISGYTQFSLGDPTD